MCISVFFSLYSITTVKLRLAINYNFDNITNPEEVYMIIQNNLNKNL